MTRRLRRFRDILLIAGLLLVVAATAGGLVELASNSPLIFVLVPILAIAAGAVVAIILERYL